MHADDFLCEELCDQHVVLLVHFDRMNDGECVRGIEARRRQDRVFDHRQRPSAGFGGIDCVDCCASVHHGELPSRADLHTGPEQVQDHAQCGFPGRLG